MDIHQEEVIHIDVGDFQPHNDPEDRAVGPYGTFLSSFTDGDHADVVCMNPYRTPGHDDDEEASVEAVTDRGPDHLHEHRLGPVPDPPAFFHRGGRALEGRGGCGGGWDGESRRGGGLAADNDGPPAADFGEETTESFKRRSVIVAGVQSVKYAFSLALLAFSGCATVSAAVGGQTGATRALAGEGWPASSLLAAGAVLLLLCLIAVEGAEAALDRGPGRSAGGEEAAAGGNASLAAEARRLGDGGRGCGAPPPTRFAVGHRLLFTALVFALQYLAGPVPGATITWPGCLSGDGGSAALRRTFLDWGAAHVFAILTVGQLAARIRAEGAGGHRRPDVAGGCGAAFVLRVALWIESSGLLHCVYAAQDALGRIVRRPLSYSGADTCAAVELPLGSESDSQENGASFWTRAGASVAILGLALYVALTAIAQGTTIEAASVLAFLLIVFFVGMMEGIQTALLAVQELPQEHTGCESKAEKVALANCRLALQERSAEDFLLGRRIWVTVGTFLAARMTTTALVYRNDAPLVVVAGAAGVLIVTVASLMGRVVAASAPVSFLSAPLVRHAIRLCLLLEASSVFSAAWVLARWYPRYLMGGHQVEEFHNGGWDNLSGPAGLAMESASPAVRRNRDIDRLVTILKYGFSLVLLVMSVLMMTATFAGQSLYVTPRNMCPLATFLIFWFLLVWLAMMEGGQGCLISLKPIDKGRYADSHPLALKNAVLAHKGRNVERFIMGRQFLVFLIVFIINFMRAGTSSESADVATMLGLPRTMCEIVVPTGMAMIFLTIIVGQLTSQVNAAVCMLDFINNRFMLFTTYVSLGIERSGLLHSAYLVQIIFSEVTGEPINYKEGPGTTLQISLFWGRVLMSLVILAFSLAVTLTALFQGKTTVWECVPGTMSVVVFFLLMCFVGMFEGIQIALFGVLNMPAEAIAKSKVAKANCDLAFRDQNLQALLIGRQFCVTTCMFVIARITTLNLQNDETILGIPRGFQGFLNSGLLGAVITTIMASMAWRIIASSFPLAFLSNPFIYLTIRLCLLVESSGVCSAAWMLARLHKIAANYQPDEVYLDGAPKHTSTPSNKREKDIDVTVMVIKYIYSTSLLIFSVSLVIGVILAEQTRLSQQSRPYAAVFVFWFLLAWLAAMEGGQGCLIGLKRVEKHLYASSHPVALKCTALSHEGDNMERFIIGRQFLVFVVVFTTNLCLVMNPLDGHLENKVFLSSGAAVILTTIILGQLTAQVTAANCMLDFVNSRVMLFTTYVSLLTELTGILHSVYLVQMMFSKIAGIPMTTKAPPRNAPQRAIFWGRVIMSLLLLGFAFAITLGAIVQGKTTMWKGVPRAATVILFFVLMGFVGLFEGLQIALFEVISMPEEHFVDAKVAKANRDIAFRGQNLQAILIGRQICVTTCMFVVARITTLNFQEGDTIFGVSQGLQKIFNTGLLGAFTSSIVASLAWRIVASSFPLTFLSNPLIYFIIRLCLILEKSGICSASWLFALFHKAIAGFRVDEVYIGAIAEHTQSELNQQQYKCGVMNFDKFSTTARIDHQKIQYMRNLYLNSVGLGVENSGSVYGTKKLIPIPPSQIKPEHLDEDDDTLCRNRERRYAQASWKMYKRIAQARSYTQNTMGGTTSLRGQAHHNNQPGTPDKFILCTANELRFPFFADNDEADESSFFLRPKDSTWVCETPPGNPGDSIPSSMQAGNPPLPQDSDSTAVHVTSLRHNKESMSAYMTPPGEPDDSLFWLTQKACPPSGKNSNALHVPSLHPRTASVFGNETSPQPPGKLLDCSVKIACDPMHERNCQLDSEDLAFVYETPPENLEGSSLFVAKEDSTFLYETPSGKPDCSMPHRAQEANPSSCCSEKIACHSMHERNGQLYIEDSKFVYETPPENLEGPSLFVAKEDSALIYETPPGKPESSMPHRAHEANPPLKQDINVTSLRHSKESACVYGTPPRKPDGSLFCSMREACPPSGVFGNARHVASFHPSKAPALTYETSPQPPGNSTSAHGSSPKKSGSSLAFLAKEASKPSGVKPSGVHIGLQDINDKDVTSHPCQKLSFPFGNAGDSLLFSENEGYPTLCGNNALSDLRDEEASLLRCEDSTFEYGTLTGEPNKSSVREAWPPLCVPSISHAKVSLLPRKGFGANLQDLASRLLSRSFKSPDAQVGSHGYPYEGTACLSLFEIDEIDD